ncbi:FadR/GntR family transcriptional regulator [Paenibacillus sp. MSJ-34]|uniref:FadR/GntR family transcriptional regulator n=1 Tax=Paenibacillus sp. MSJ-34 TaxID=2841529 RepID=UPI001C123668|nr:FadR family transcriptional regulator [Paenibacillus sp. MSJ-34]
MTNNFKAIEKKNIVDDVYEQMKEKIVNGVWQAGDKIPSENELCSMFNVSRVSVRSAVQKLRDMGLISTRHGKGSFVSNTAGSYDLKMMAPIMNMSEKEFVDIMEFRELIETKCIELAVERADEQDILAIEKALNEMKANQNDYAKYSVADYQFHMAIVHATKNELFVQIMKSMKRVYYYHLEELNRVLGELEVSLKGHTQQYQAIKNRDTELVKRLVRESVTTTTDRTIKWLRYQEKNKK